ncbi:MAG TPA: hypothetical protein VHU83_00245 [Bryobacteraceae bacterium]|jgi:hypothetical protein|nr:hypothetical protein [Bryobacteraceae bacterium]
MPPFGKYTPRFLGLITLNVVALSALSMLAVRGAVPVYPWLAFSCLLLFVVDWLVLRKLARSLLPLAAPRPPSARLLVLPVLYSVMGILTLIAFVRNTTTSRGLQLAWGVVVISAIWYLVYRIRQAGKGQIPK